jgi:hypothetical protein
MSYQCSCGHPWSYRGLAHTFQDPPHSLHTLLGFFFFPLLNWTLSTYSRPLRFSSIASTSRLLNRASCPDRLLFRSCESPLSSPLEIAYLSV